MVDPAAKYLRQTLALNLVRADATGLLDWHSFVKVQDDGVLGLIFMPVFSLFLVELHKYLVSGGAPGNLGVPATILRAANRSRASMKQAEHVHEYLIQLTGVATAHREALRGGNGIRGLFRRLLADDLGLYFLNGNVITSTHHCAMGMGGQTMSPMASGIREQGREVGNNAGLFAGAAAHVFGISPEVPDQPEKLVFELRDTRANVCLREIGKQIGTRDCAFASAILGVSSALNVAKFVMPALPWRSPVFSFKTRFVKAFHALSSLERLINYGCQAGLLSDGSARVLAGDRATLKATKEVTSREKIRKLLVHYENHATDLRDVMRRGVAGPLTEIATGKVPAELSDLLEHAVERNVANLSFISAAAIGSSRPAPP